jgi:hypothetical protein
MIRGWLGKRFVRPRIEIRSSTRGPVKPETPPSDGRSRAIDGRAGSAVRGLDPSVFSLRIATYQEESKCDEIFLTVPARGW